MALVTHIEQLRQKHAQLEASLKAEQLRPMPDFAVISQLKKHKLALNDELVRLNKESPPHRKTGT